jgi:hypothetical protein
MKLIKPHFQHKQIAGMAFFIRLGFYHNRWNNNLMSPLFTCEQNSRSCDSDSFILGSESLEAWVTSVRMRSTIPP